MARAVTASDVSVGAALDVNGTVLVPLLVTRKQGGAGQHGVWLQAQRCVCAVLVEEAGGELRAFAVDGTARDPQSLMAAFPDLAAAIAAARG